MSFLSPYLLAFAAVLAVPLWLHLRRKRRQTPVEFPSLRYLKMAAARTKRQARVEDPVLLLLRLLLVALVVAACARPVLRSQSGWFGKGRAVETVVVIDSTASMNWRGPAGTRLEAAKRLASQWVEGLADGDTAALWVLGDSLDQPVPVPIADRGHWFRALDAVGATEGSAGLASVFKAAREWADGHGDGPKELVIITDNQAAAWDWPAEGFFKQDWQRAGMRLVVLAPDNIVAANACVAEVTWVDRSAREGGLLNGVARLANHGPTAVADVLECRLAGQTVMRHPVTIPAGGSLEVPLALAVPPTPGPVLTGELNLTGDALMADDHWYFAQPLRRPYQALVVEPAAGATGVMRAGFFLTKALAAGGAGKVETIEAKSWPARVTEGWSSLWFTGGGVTDGAAWAKALAFADAGGTVVVAADGQPDPLPPGWPVTTGAETPLPAGRIATRLVVPEHPLLAGVWTEKTPFPPLPQRMARAGTPTTGAKVLATVAGGLPFLVELPHGRGRIMWLNASVDRTWGDLPLAPVFVALVQQLARAAELTSQTACQAWVGEAWPDLTSITADATWPADPRAVQPGLHEAVGKDGSTRWRCAVNVRRAESDLRAVPAARLEAMLPGHIAAGAPGLRDWQARNRREVPLWPWLLAAVGVVFALEGWLAKRAVHRKMAAAGTAMDLIDRTGGRAGR